MLPVVGRHQHLPHPSGPHRLLVHPRPFQTGEQCLAFAKLFRTTYDDKASGAQIVNAFCIEPYKKKVINEARATVLAARRTAGGRR